MPATAKDKALRLLTVRSRSRDGLRRRLIQAGFEPPEVETTLDDLERVGLLDDRKFAEDLLNYKLRRGGYGSRAALTALRKEGVPREIAEEAVASIRWDDEEARAEEVAWSRASRLSSLPHDVAYRRLLDFLQRRGFDPEVARTVANRVLESDSPRV